MNTNIVLSLDTRRAKKDGTFPLMMRLGHNGRTTSIPTGFSLRERDWNETDRKVKPSFGGVSSVTRLNNALQKKKADALDIILKLDEMGKLKGMSITDLRKRVDPKNEGKSVFVFMEELTMEFRKAGRDGSADIHRQVLNILKSYVGPRGLSFPEINYAFLTKFEATHLAKGSTLNSFAVYMRTIRGVFNRAVKAGLVEKELYPFNDYKIRTQPTKKRALAWEPLQKIIEAQIEPGDKLFHPRNYFLCSYFLYGMNFKDMAFLKKTDLAGGRVSYRRGKTAKLYDIKIKPQLEKILAYYIDLNPDGEYVFPILKREKRIDQHNSIKWARKRYNNRLKELAEHCGIETNLTSYVSRHSFATQASLHDVPLLAIQAMLGHGSVNTTQIYLASLPINALDDYNDKIPG